RIVALRDHLAALLRNESFDVLHAHDGIGGNALADLRASGRIGGHVRTVHHLDRFADERVQAWEERAIRDARRVLSVSAAGRDRLRDARGSEWSVAANGGALARYTPRPCRGDAELARRLGVGAGGPVVLLVGGIEARKNTRRLLAALRLLRRVHPQAQLVVAGGASVLDHRAEAVAFRADAAAAGLAIGAHEPVVVTGPVPDADMPALYRRADVLAMPSLLEGFGLAALEALACGTPAVVSRSAPFTEVYGAGEVEWADPLSPQDIAAALALALARGRHGEPPAVCRRHRWAASAECPEALYRLPVAEPK